MHSNIYQISEEKNFDEVSAWGIEEQMPFADYVYETGEKEKLLRHKREVVSLKERVGKYGVKVDEKESTIVFKKGFKERYFKNKFKSFKKLTNDLTLEAFSGETSSNGSIHLIETALEDKFSAYIYDDYPKTLDDFVRELKEEKTYYLGEIFGYKW